MSKTLFNKQFYASWICCTTVMFGLTYFWHGVVLNDYSLLNYPTGTFLATAAFVYLVIGFIISFGYRYLTIQKKIKDRFIKGIIAGSLTGIIVYLVTWLLGISYSKQITLNSILIDLIWQIIEQTMGGITVSIIHYSIWVDEPFFPKNKAEIK